MPDRRPGPQQQYVVNFLKRRCDEGAVHSREVLENQAVQGRKQCPGHHLHVIGQPGGR